MQYFTSWCVLGDYLWSWPARPNHNFPFSPSTLWWETRIQTLGTRKCLVFNLGTGEMGIIQFRIVAEDPSDWFKWLCGNKPYWPSSRKRCYLRFWQTYCCFICFRTTQTTQLANNSAHVPWGVWEQCKKSWMVNCTSTETRCSSTKATLQGDPAIVDDILIWQHHWESNTQPSCPTLSFTGKMSTVTHQTKRWQIPAEKDWIIMHGGKVDR